MMALAAAIRRHRAGLPRPAWLDAMGLHVTPTTLERWERGAIPRERVAELLRLVDASPDVIGAAVAEAVGNPHPWGRWLTRAAGGSGPHRRTLAAVLSCRGELLDWLVERCADDV